MNGYGFHDGLGRLLNWWLTGHHTSDASSYFIMNHVHIKSMPIACIHLLSTTLIIETISEHFHPTFNEHCARRKANVDHFCNAIWRILQYEIPLLPCRCDVVIGINDNTIACLIQSRASGAGCASLYAVVGIVDEDTV